VPNINSGDQPGPSGGSICAPWSTPGALDCVIPEGQPELGINAIDVASEVLWVLSGRQFGICVRTTRPAGPGCHGGPWPSLALGQQTAPYAAGVLGVGGQLGLPGRPCGCSAKSAVKLPGRVVSVISVVVDGETLDPGDYRLSRRQLYRTDGGRWPACQHLDARPNEPGYFAVTYRRGRAIPVSGTRAVNELACELVKARLGDSKCALPKRVQTITRQGMTIGLLDPMTFLEKGKTGLYWCDLFLSTWNPRGYRRSARGWSPTDVRSRG